jgi:hypothetical protein
MTPEQKLKHLILSTLANHRQEDTVEITAGNIDELYDEACENDDGGLQDAREEVRCGGTGTGLQAPWSRHYEVFAVAVKTFDGSWVGFNYWYGGGKHGEPEAIDWMDEAYDLTVTEEEKMVVVRTFAKAA